MRRLFFAGRIPPRRQTAASAQLQQTRVKLLERLAVEKRRG